MRIAAFILFAGLAVAAPARATIVEVHCHRVVIHDTTELDGIALDGPIVRPAVKQRCVGDDTTVEYFSPVHLTASGLCKSAVYDEKRRSYGTVLVRRGPNCPQQSYGKYAWIGGISDAEFFALARYLERMLESGRLPIDTLVAHALTPANDGMPARERYEKLETGLRGVRDAPESINGFARFPNYQAVRLSPDEMRARKYVIETRHGLELYLVAMPAGLELVGIDLLVP